MKLLGICLVIIFACHGFTILGAEIYYWTDENGVKHYSNDPPPDRTAFIKTADEIPYDPAEDEQSEAVDEKKLEEIIAEIEAENKSQAEAESPIPQAEGQPKSSKPLTRDERIQKEKEKLEHIIAYLENQPVSSFHNQRSKQQFIGRYRQKLQKLLQSPDTYFGW